MQFQLVPAFLIFVGSYLPLALILAAQDIPRSWWARPVCTSAAFLRGACDFNPFASPFLSVSAIILCAAAVLLAWAVLRQIHFPFSIEVKRVKATPNELINYTFPYVVSFMGVSYDDPQKLLGFAIFLIWMFAITYKSGQILMNPLLLILGWRLYEATILYGVTEMDVRILSRGHLNQGPVFAQTIQDFYIVKG